MTVKSGFVFATLVLLLAGIGGCGTGPQAVVDLLKVMPTEAPDPPPEVDPQTPPAPQEPVTPAPSLANKEKMMYRGEANPDGRGRERSHHYALHVGSHYPAGVNVVCSGERYMQVLNPSKRYEPGGGRLFKPVADEPMNATFTRGAVFLTDYGDKQKDCWLEW